MFAVMCIIGGAFAQTTPPDPFDYTTSIEAFKTDMTTFLQTNGPLLLGVLVLCLAFGIVWKLIKRAAKSVG
jgi:hypothetical protein